MPSHRNPHEPRKRDAETHDESIADDTRPGAAPKGDAGKHPWTKRPPQGWGRHSGGPAGKKPPKRGKK